MVLELILVWSRWQDKDLVLRRQEEDSQEDGLSNLA